MRMMINYGEAFVRRLCWFFWK